MGFRELTALILLCAVWGLHFVVVKVAVAEVPPLFYAAVRMSLVAAVMAPFLRWRPGQMRTVIAAGLCMGVFNYAFLFSGLSLATASAAAVAIELYVPFAMALSVIFLKETIGPKRIFGAAVAFAGVVLVTLGEEGGGSGALALGVALVAGGAFSEAVGAILVKRLDRFEPFQLLAWFALVGATGLWGLAFAVDGQSAGVLLEVDRTLLIGAALYSAFGASIFGHSAYYWLLKRAPVSQVAGGTLLTTVFGVLAGVLILKDPLQLSFVIGGFMVIGGVGLILARDAKAAVEMPGTA